MRILKSLFSTFFSFVVVALVGGFLFRESVLFLGTKMIQDSLADLLHISRTGGSYTAGCQKKGGSGGVEELRLRFVDKKTYVVEAVCAGFPLDPIEVKRETLPLLVTKRAGSTGIVWGNELSGVGIEVLGRRRDIWVENEDVSARPPTAETLKVVATDGATVFGKFPVSTCSGYGYRCCQPDVARGEGGAYELVSDCPKTCFSSCTPRPLVVSLNSDPYPDQATRQILIKTGESVSFSYAASYEGKEPVTAKLEFGDGKVEAFEGLRGEAAHAYACAAPQCRFEGRLILTTKSGVESADTSLTHFVVLVTQ